MPTNVEIKARVRDMGALLARVERISGAPGRVIEQEDTFFHAEKGRLKLRVLAPDRGELIAYERADVSGPKVSDFLIARTDDPDSLKRVLAAALGIRGVVRKRRALHIVDPTRIHLDEVEGLGDFMELEVMLGERQSIADGQAIAEEWMRRLGIEPGDLVQGAYMDLLEREADS